MQIDTGNCNKIKIRKYKKKLITDLHTVYMSAIMYMKVKVAPHLALEFKGFFFALFCLFWKNPGGFIGKFLNVAYNRESICFIAKPKEIIKWVY